MNIAICETRDASLVWDISQDDSVRDRITDDKLATFSPEVQAHVLRELVHDPKNHTLAVCVNGAAGGCFMFDQTDLGVFEVHTMLLPNARGLSAISAGRMAIKWMFARPEVEKLVSYCPALNPEILFFALRCGFKKAGVIVGGWVQNGVATDLVKVELKGEN
jgi:RimJ/RimL family protein N-acetyltransferase